MISAAYYLTDNPSDEPQGKPCDQRSTHQAPSVLGPGPERAVLGLSGAWIPNFNRDYRYKWNDSWIENPANGT